MKIDRENIENAKAQLKNAKKSAKEAADGLKKIVLPKESSVNFSVIVSFINDLSNEIEKSIGWLSTRKQAIEQAESKSQAIIAGVGGGFSGISVGGNSGKSFLSSSNQNSVVNSQNSETKLENKVNDNANDKNEVVKLEDREITIEKIIQNSEFLKALDKSIVDKYKAELLKQISDGKFDFSNMTEKQILGELIKIIITKEDLTADQVFNGLKELNGYYGANQTVINDLTEDETKALQEAISKRYNLVIEDATNIIKELQDAELKEYDIECNLIYLTFKNQPEEFEKAFGFSLYRTDSNGNVAINDIDLIADLFVFARNNENKNISEIIEDYIKSKGIDFEYNIETISEKVSNELITDEMISNIKDKIKEEIETGKKHVILNIYQNEEHTIKMIDTETKKVVTNTDVWKDIESKEVLVTEVTDEGVIVSASGKRYLISFDELKDNGEFETYSREYNIKK